MTKITLTIRGLDADLIKQVRSKAARQGIKPSEWLNDAIREKLVNDANHLPFDLDDCIEKTDHPEVYKVPLGTIIVNNDYAVGGIRICAAGRKKGEEVVTIDSPGSLADLGYEIFWVK